MTQYSADTATSILPEDLRSRLVAAHKSSMHLCLEFFEQFPPETRACLHDHLWGRKPIFRVDEEEVGIPFVTLLGIDLGLDEPAILHLDFLTNLFNVHHAILDSLADDTSVWTSERSERLFISDIFNIEFLRLASETFDDRRCFWNFITRYTAEFTQANLWEIKHHRGTVCTYRDEDFVNLSHKSSPMKIVFAAVCQQAGKLDLTPLFESYVDNLAIGLQMPDDLKDWEDDVRMGLFTYPVTLALQRIGHSEGEAISVTDDLLGRIAKELYLTPLSREVLALSVDRLSEAAEMIRSCAPLLCQYSLEKRDNVAGVISQLVKKQCEMFAQLFPDKMAQFSSGSSLEQNRGEVQHAE